MSPPTRMIKSFLIPLVGLLLAREIVHSGRFYMHGSEMMWVTIEFYRLKKTFFTSLLIEGHAHNQCVTQLLSNNLAMYNLLY